MRSPHSTTLALAAILALQATAVMAAGTEEEELAQAYGDKSTVSIATGSKQSLRRAPAVATVITAEDIAATGASDLDEVLETVPGLHVSRTPGSYNPTYIMRGIGAGQTNPQVLLLQNGIPMTTVYAGDKGTAWGGYPVDHIARIEIIRGPGSALYGADAYAGVINIITKTADDTPGTQIGGRRGSFDTWDTWLQHGSKSGKFEVAGYLRAGHTDGFKETLKADNQTRLDGLFGTSASLAPGPVNTGHDAVDGNLDLAYDKFRWRTGYKEREHIGTGAGFSQALDPNGFVNSKRITTDLSWTDLQFARDWGLGFIASYLYYAEETPNGLFLFPPGSTFPTGTFPNGVIGGPNRWERQFRVSMFATYSGFTDHKMRIGTGYDDLDLYNTATNKNYLLNPVGLPIPTGPVQDYNSIQPHILPQRRKIDYVYAQDEWQMARDVALTAGLRHDHYSDFGNTTNPRAALVWEAAYNLTAKLLYGEAFRAPSFNEQYGINPVANGNPNLRPETIKTSEAALSWQARPDTQLNLSLFRYHMKDIIRAVPNSGAPGSTYANTGDQTGEGAELEAVWDASRSLRFTANHSTQRSLDLAADSDAGYAPHNRTYGRADWRFASGWLMSPQVNWVRGRKRVSGDNRPDVPDYTIWDVTVQSQAKRDHWNAMFSVRNVFNRDAREPSPAPGFIPNDLPLPGRWYLLQLSLQL